MFARLKVQARSGSQLSLIRWDLYDKYKGYPHQNSYQEFDTIKSVIGGQLAMKFSVESLYNWYRETIRNPKYRWWIVGGSLLYLLSPIDISPDIFPIIGWIDDGVIATLLVAEVSSILLDRLKASKSDASGTTSTQPNSTNAAVVDDVVEVDAVSVK
ncbi:MAG: YkvA family protein [Leptolyngbyaceae cyanobacterium bins.302]|nr:YkvA family protein [Leptolyngbyaceae cyanobacterium bins.302]